MKRSNKIYKEIEEFKKYELTYCIAYEMAIRNSKLIKIFKSADPLKTDLFNFEQYEDTLKKFGINLECYDYAIVKFITVIYTYINGSVGRIDGNTNDIPPEHIISKEEAEKILYKEKKSNIISKSPTLKQLKDWKLTIYSFLLDLDKLYTFKINNTSDSIDPSFNFIKKATQEDIDKSTKSSMFWYGNSLDCLTLISSDLKLINFGKEFLDTLGLEDFRSDSIECEIYYSRPKLQFENQKYGHININLNIPLEELQSYLEVIIERKSHITSPSELLEIQFESYKTPKKYPKNKDKNFTIQQKWADWFFVYDYYSQAKDENQYKHDKVIFEEIDQQLLDYYDDGGVVKGGNFEYWKKPDVYRKTILPTMKELIEELGYKSLITG